MVPFIQSFPEKETVFSRNQRSEVVLFDLPALGRFTTFVRSKENIFGSKNEDQKEEMNFVSEELCEWRRRRRLVIRRGS
jgi:hypothetical protein